MKDEKKNVQESSHKTFRYTFLVPPCAPKLCIKDVFSLRYHKNNKMPEKNGAPFKLLFIFP